jgi:hypothetical protein
MPMGDLVGKDPPRRDVVAITESAGDRDDLEITQQIRIFQQAIDVNRFRRRPGHLKRMRRLRITIHAGGPKDQCAGVHVDTLASSKRK